MKVNVWNTILQLSKERDVEPRIIIKAIEESLRIAAARHFSRNEKVQVDFRPEKGELRVFVEKKAVKNPVDPAVEISIAEAKLTDTQVKLGDTVRIDLPSETLGRIAASAAKQVIFQKVRDAEQEKIFDEFNPLTGKIISGVYRRTENEAMILELNKTEIALPIREAIPGEEFRRGDIVKAVIIQVLKSSKGPQVIVSRTSPRFVAKLFEIEVPEIASGLIEIKNIARQPGERSKVAVFGRDKAVDPIGACIGVRGNRIMAITAELKGEKIDIIEWSPDPSAFARASLSPARVDKLTIVDKNEKILQAVLAKDQLSLAIGKKGINVKLASRLVGWKINIKQE